jgi:hypothetical protein
VTARIEGKLPTHPITETPRRQRDDGIKFKKKKRDDGANPSGGSQILDRSADTQRTTERVKTAGVNFFPRVQFPLFQLKMQ